MHYGTFFAHWSAYEILIEILIKRQLGVTYEKASILSASLGFGAKANILYSLLNDAGGHEEGIRLLKTAQNIAKRNTFSHGFLFCDLNERRFHLISREVKDKYKVKKKSMSFDEMEHHASQFGEAFTAVKAHFKVKLSEIDNYALLIANRE